MAKGKKKKEDNDDFDYYTKEVLTEPMLFERIVLDGLDEQIVGEDNARKCIFLCAMGSRVNNARNTSFNLMVNSDSGAGKDHVVDAVLKIFKYDEEIVQKRTRISPMVLTYWHDAKWEPDWTWDGKILYLEDCSNQILNCDVFKVFASGGSHATVVREQRAVDVKIVGKPVIIITSASAAPAHELIRRFLVVNLTETENQTGEVMDRWAEHSINGSVPKLNSDYHHALKYVLPRCVKIPFAKNISKTMPREHIHMRTHFSRFMDLIKASAVLHQWQRVIDEDEFVIADGADYNIARGIMLATSSNKLMIPLTQNQKEVISILKEIGMNIVESESGNETEVGWTIQELMNKLFLSKTQLYRELNKLVKFGFLVKTSHKFQHDYKKSTVYYYKEAEALTLPTWDEIIGKTQ